MAEAGPVAREGCWQTLLMLPPTDGVSLQMIEDLKAMIDNISQEVALLKEKQALQTGKALTAVSTLRLLL